TRLHSTLGSNHCGLTSRCSRSCRLQPRCPATVHGSATRFSWTPAPPPKSSANCTGRCNEAASAAWSGSTERRFPAACFERDRQYERSLDRRREDHSSRRRFVSGARGSGRLSQGQHQAIRVREKRRVIEGIEDFQITEPEIAQWLQIGGIERFRIERQLFTG